MFPIQIDCEVQKIIRHLEPFRKRNIKEALRALSQNPNLGKTLQDSLTGLNSYRVGNLRIIYLIKKKTIHVIALGPRNVIYKELEKQKLKKKS